MGSMVGGFAPSISRLPRGGGASSPHSRPVALLRDQFQESKGPLVGKHWLNLLFPPPTSTTTKNHSPRHVVTPLIAWLLARGEKRRAVTSGPPPPKENKCELRVINLPFRVTMGG